jgi:hypothetical protein
MGVIVEKDSALIHQRSANNKHWLLTAWPMGTFPSKLYSFHYDGREGGGRDNQQMFAEYCRSATGAQDSHPAHISCFGSIFCEHQKAHAASGAPTQEMRGSLFCLSTNLNDFLICSFGFLLALENCGVRRRS